MMITFLRAFTATRMVKGKFRLANRNGGAKQHFAFGPCHAEFSEGQQIEVATLVEGSSWIVTGNPVLGEVVLDGAVEGVDFQVVHGCSVLAEHA